VIAHDDFEGIRGDVDVDLQRTFLAPIGVQHDVVAGLCDGRADVVEIVAVDRERVRHSAQRLAYQRHVLGPVGEAQIDIRWLGHQGPTIALSR
jgi:hypothetical protein